MATLGQRHRVGPGPAIWRFLKMKKFLVALPLVALVAACGGSKSDGGSAGTQLKIVGSSTVYPFTTAVSEEFQRANPGSSAIVESTGTGAGIKLFCAGVGAQFPDAVNASRPMKAGEYADCEKNGAKNIIELPVGIDGLTLIQAKGQPALNLTVAQIYKALAAKPFGKEQTAKTWADVDPALPAESRPWPHTGRWPLQWMSISASARTF